MITTFKQYLRLKENAAGGGQAAGNVEVAKVDLPEARTYAQQAFAKNDKDLSKELPNFNKNFEFAQSKAKEGSTVRKDMPVIDEKDVKDLQTRLTKGSIDIKAPFAPGTNQKNPFPQGLTGEQADEFLTNGFKDKKLKDDHVKVKMTTVACGSLTPIQKQIYLDKCIDATAKAGTAASTNFLKNSMIIISSDDHIIDGHHRWMSAVMINPKMTMKALQIDLPIGELLSLTLAYGDAEGNKRND